MASVSIPALPRVTCGRCSAAGPVFEIGESAFCLQCLPAVLEGRESWWTRQKRGIRREERFAYLAVLREFNLAAGDSAPSLHALGTGRAQADALMADGLYRTAVGLLSLTLQLVAPYERELPEASAAPHPEVGPEIRSMTVAHVLSCRLCGELATAAVALYNDDRNASARTPSRADMYRWLGVAGRTMRDRGQKHREQYGFPPVTPSQAVEWRNALT